MKAELVPDNGDPPIPITRDLTVIGRREPCDVVIDHHSLSKRHAVVVKTDGLLVIRDLATTNGTKVKGQKIRWAALLPDDRITLGSYKLRVYLGPDHVPGPSERAGAGKAVPTSRAAAPASRGAGGAKPKPTPTPRPVPAAPEVPDEPEFEVVDEGEGEGESGWRKLIGSRDQGDDVIIELE